MAKADTVVDQRHKALVSHSIIPMLTRAGSQWTNRAGLEEGGYLLHGERMLKDGPVSDKNAASPRQSSRVLQDFEEQWHRHRIQVRAIGSVFHQGTRSTSAQEAQRRSPG